MYKLLDHIQSRRISLTGQACTKCKKKKKTNVPSQYELYETVFESVTGCSVVDTPL